MQDFARKSPENAKFPWAFLVKTHTEIFKSPEEKYFFLRILTESAYKKRNPARRTSWMNEKLAEN